MKFKAIFLATAVSFGLISAAYAQDYSKLLKGKRLILKEATCAGLEFKDDKKVLMYAELECSKWEEPTAHGQLKWLSQNTFVVVETSKDKKDCPPRNWIYQIQSVVGNQVKLKEFWTGWGNSKDEVLEYTIK